MGTPSGKIHYPELDALRGIAALVVVLFHFTLDRPESAYGFALGMTGVDWQRYALLAARGAAGDAMVEGEPVDAAGRVGGCGKPGLSFSMPA